MTPAYKHWKQLRGWLVHHHLLIDDDGVHLIDGGFIGGIGRIRKVLAQEGLKLSDIQSLILTHGHLDHTLNAAKIKNLTGCQVYAPELDREHVEGRFRYLGPNRVCGFLEWLGRMIFRWRAPDVDQWFNPGDELDIAGGLKVIGLPGHTVGHCGFLTEDGLLFAGDLFTNHLGTPKAPPRIFNDQHPLALKSIRTAASLDLTGVSLNHARPCSPEEALRDLRELIEE